MHTLKFTYTYQGRPGQAAYNVPDHCATFDADLKPFVADCIEQREHYEGGTIIIQSIELETRTVRNLNGILR